MNNEIAFTKYKTRGYGYHWEQNSSHPIKMNASVKARYQKCLALLSEEIGTFSGKKIIDLGCGDGVITYELSHRGAESYGVDLSEEAINFAIKKHKSLGSDSKFFVESCNDTHFDDEYFDAIISSDVIEHLSDPKELLLEIKRLLRPGGVAVVSTPVRVTEEPLDQMHTIEWFPAEFREFVGEVFPDARFEYTHPIFWNELMSRSFRHKLLVNFVSYIKNPFLSTSKWKYYRLQYAIIKKS
jgi:2-polyprenyl-3-methyl-5-hydroxy-6-metoxy-1,4-benzoquinol methylase